MVRFINVLVAALTVAVLSGLTAGCADESPRPLDPAPIASIGAPPFHPPSYPPGRSIDTIASTVTDGGRVPVFIVASRSDSLRGGGRFDLVEIYAFDTTRRQWTLVLADSVDAAQRLEMRDITGDGREDLVLPLSYGGNDPIATKGMHVYSSHDGAFRRVFRSTWMDPRIDSLTGLNEEVITVRRALWPLFAPRADALVYVEDVFGFRDGRFQSILGEARMYFEREANRARIDYGAARDTFEHRALIADTTGILPRGEPVDVSAGDSLLYVHELRLYQTSALVVLHSVKSGDARGARMFWSGEKEFLRGALRIEQYDELEAFCRRLLDVG